MKNMSKSKDKDTRNKIIAASIILIVAGGGGFMLGWLSGRDWFFSTREKQITPDLDGTINKREWLRSSYYNIPFYLDVDNTLDPITNLANLDGWNYLSVGEDEKNYYIALDLCSDRTNNIDGEWVALALANRMPQVTNAKLGLYAIENYGLEFLMYNVSANTMIEDELIPSGGSGNFNSIPFVPEYDSYNVIKGTQEGDYLDFWYTDDSRVLTLKSEYFDLDSHYNESDLVVVEFAVNVTEKFPSITNPSTFIPFITDFDCRIRLTGNISASNSLNPDYSDYFSLRVAEHGPIPLGYDDPNYLNEVNNIAFSNGTFTNAVVDLDHTAINATNGMFYFSLYGWNNLNVTDPTEYEIYIDQLEFRITTSSNFATTTGASVNEGNYDVSYAFGSSDMCGEDHRMFEIRIAKSEFPDLSDDMLFVNVAGYGTMAIADSNYWVYPQSDIGIMASPLFEFYDDSIDFLRFDMSIT
jgi:hypothetical protein